MFFDKLKLNNIDSAIDKKEFIWFLFNIYFIFRQVPCEFFVFIIIFSNLGLFIVYTSRGKKNSLIYLPCLYFI
jgi:ABC-type methionine transport system permease subunit